MKLIQCSCYFLIISFVCSCQLHTSEVLVRRMNGAIIQIFNPEQISCYKGDTVIVGIHCGYNSSSCDMFLCGIYRGKSPENYQLNFSDHIETGTYEKAIFLKEIKN